MLNQASKPSFISRPLQTNPKANPKLILEPYENSLFATHKSAYSLTIPAQIIPVEFFAKPLLRFAYNYLNN